MVSQESQEFFEHLSSHAESFSTPSSSMIGKVLNKRVALAAADQPLALSFRRW